MTQTRRVGPTLAEAAPGAVLPLNTRPGLQVLDTFILNEGKNVPRHFCLHRHHFQAHVFHSSRQIEHHAWVAAARVEPNMMPRCQLFKQPSRGSLDSRSCGSAAQRLIGQKELAKRDPLTESQPSGLKIHWKGGPFAAPLLHR